MFALEKKRVYPEYKKGQQRLNHNFWEEIMAKKATKKAAKKATKKVAKKATKKVAKKAAKKATKKKAAKKK